MESALPERDERQRNLRDLLIECGEEHSDQTVPADIANLIVGFMPSLPSFHCIIENPRRSPLWYETLLKPLVGLADQINLKIS